MTTADRSSVASEADDGTTAVGADPEAGEAAEGETPEEAVTGAVTRAPTLLSRRLAVVAAVTVTVLAGVASLPALALGLVGVVVLWAATLDGRQGLVDVGGVVLLLTTVVAGRAAPVPVTLACTVGTVVAWDVATNAVELGEQMGRDADTTRAEVSHVLATTGVGVVLAAVSYGVYVLGGGGQPVGAVIALLVGALALLSALRL